MNEYCQYLKSDIYKLQHSWFFWVHLLFPVLGAALILLYSRLSSGSELNKLAAFTQIIAIVFPFVVSIVCQIVAEQEVQAGRFQNMLTLPSRSKAIFSKLAILLLAGLFSTALSTVLFGVLFSYMTGTKLPIGFFVLIPIVLWGSNVMMYGLHLILAFCFGRNLGISIGVIGSLLSALFQTGLGTGLWYIIPYGHGVRFAESALAYLFDLPPAGNLENQIGIISCTVFTCGTIGLIAFWFSRYSGTSSD